MTASERGEVSLISVLVACTLLVVVLGASLSIFEGFTARAGDQTQRTKSQDAARSAADRIARNLRNLADPTTPVPQVVERIGARDLIFKMVDGSGVNTGTNTTNTKRVRYCLDESKRQLLEQTQTWTTATAPSMPGTAACPGGGWPPARVAATDVVNPVGQPVFGYDTTVESAVTGIHVDLLVDGDVTRAPGPTRLSTGVFLRNQNRVPTASFVATPTAGGVVLNGSASNDPEGEVLDYAWTDPAATKPEIGTGITFSYTGLTPGVARTITLTVTDPAGLENSTTRTVTP